MKVFRSIFLVLALSFSCLLSASSELVYEVLNVDKIQDGDVVCYRGAFRSLLKVATTPLMHPGIVDGDTVIEWVYLKEGSRVNRVSLASFLQRAPEGEEPFIIRFKGQRKPEEILAAARRFLKKQSEFAMNYHPVTTNCQHFAVLCATGQMRSWQLEEFQNLLSSPVVQARFAKVIKEHKEEIAALAEELTENVQEK